MKHQMTGNAGLFHIAWELTRRGWNVMPTVRNARGADLYAAPVDDEEAVIPIQSKALSKRAAVPLGTDLDRLRSRWWIITLGANSDDPVCFVLTLDEVKALATQDKGGARAYWLEAKHYDVPEFREAWHRLA
ncbi:MAG: hypothetical protein CMN17_06295 [Roseovarius sp.]|nr:hypothetical protein [Roseovarius sp.]MBK46193.1 hypothetical protein [Roseovarius sp.]|tara:strand:+ start:82 stop:477 length:396 start_codon:yes stop_codon:yes gene_type:complete